MRGAPMKIAGERVLNRRVERKEVVPSDGERLVLETETPRLKLYASREPSNFRGFVQTPHE